jgi:hypothetical protein
MFVNGCIKWTAAMLIVLLSAGSLFGAEDESGLNTLPLNSPIKMKAAVGNELQGAKYTVTRLPKGVKERLELPEMTAEESSEPVGYSIEPDYKTKTFKVVKEANVPSDLFTRAEYRVGQSVAATEGVDRLPELPKGDATTQGDVVIAATFWYLKTMVLTEDKIHIDLCKTWAQVNHDYSHAWWVYLIGWAANPSPWPLNTHWYIRKTEAFPAVWTYLATKGYWYWLSVGKGIYWNYDWLYDDKITTVKQIQNLYTRVDAYGSGKWTSIITIIKLGESAGLLHSHFYAQGVPKW